MAINVPGAYLGGSAGGGLGSLFGLLGLAGEGGEDRYRQAINVFATLSDPNFDARALTAPQLEVIREVAPQVYDAVIAQQVALPEDSPQVRGEQMAALQQLAQVRQEGLPIAERAAAQDQQRALASEYTRAQEAVLRNLAERGRLGSGTEVAARMVGNQGGSELARGMGSDLARQAVLNRLAAAYGAADVGGRLRSQDLALSESRSNTMNRFNEFVSNLQTQAARDAATARGAAEAYNVGNAQRVADTNALAAYDVAQQNLNRRNDLEAQRANYALQRAAGQSGALGNLADLQERARSERILAIDRLGQSAGGLLGGLL